MISRGPREPQPPSSKLEEDLFGWISVSGYTNSGLWGEEQWLQENSPQRVTHERDACCSYFWLRSLHINPGTLHLDSRTASPEHPQDKRMGVCEERREQIKPNGKLVSWRTDSGRPLEILYAIGGAASGVERYDPLNHEWQILGSVPRQRSGIGVASLNGSIYAAGGHDGLICLNSVERYLPKINEWKRDVAPLSEPKQEVAMAELGGYLYCAGGFDGLVCLNTLERYDPGLDRWQRLTPMKSRRKGLGLATLDGYLYAVGGSDGYSPLCSVERYDPREDRWAACPPLRNCRENLGCVALQGKIYAVGGQDELTELCSGERFDPFANQWTPVRPMRSKRSKVNLAAINGYLLAIGGYDGIVHVSTVEAFDLELNAWRCFGNMKSRHPDGGVSVIQMATENVESFKSPWSR